MRVLPSVVIAVSAPCLMAAACLLGVTGCSQFNKALGQQQAHVSFSPRTPDSVRMQVRAACGKLPNVHPAPVARSVPLSSALSEVVFRVDKAGPADIARLQTCLQKFPEVTGISLQDSTDNG